jgi:hypothetical protein
LKIGMLPWIMEQKEKEIGSFAHENRASGHRWL